MTHGSLFSGIGGFDLAAEWMGWENKFHCEWNEFGQKVLKYYWPESELFTDITKSDFTKYANQIDVLTGGFPCQPYSMAGKRLGKEDDRHLWPEMLRVIREVKPRWVIGENVLGLVNWNGGLVFHEVQADLEAEGYEVFPYVLPAVSVNAPHRRDRVWFVAYSNSFCNRRTTKQKSNSYKQRWSCETNKRIGNKREQQFVRNSSIQGNATNTNSNGLNECDSNNEINTSERGVNAFSNFDQSIINGDATNSKCERLERHRECREISGKSNKQSKFSSKRNSITNWNKWPTVSPICNGDDGLSDRLDSITFSKWRNESIKAGGNAIVPQVVYQIFKTIELYEHKRASNSTSPGSM
jgi:DNA (cytosine-5)-methyltransferase 1